MEEEAEEDATLGNWFIFMGRIHHHFCNTSVTARDNFQSLLLNMM